MNRVVRVIRGLLALGVLAALVVGLPLVLAQASLDLLPANVDLAQARVALTSPSDGRLLVALLLVVAWAAWASLMLSLAVELPAAVRRVPAPALPGLRWQQRIVGGLCAAVLAVVLAPPLLGPTAAEATPVRSGAPGAVSRQVHPTVADSSTGVTSEAGVRTHRTSDSARQYTVRRGDSLWTIAERELGDGRDWERLLRANARLIDDPQVLRPGWVLRIPGPEHTGPADSGASRGDRTHVVSAGESLWSIADSHYGSGRRWTRIAEANPRLITDPDIVRVGWRLTLPAVEGERSVREESRPRSVAGSSPAARHRGPDLALPGSIVLEGPAVRTDGAQVTVDGANGAGGARSTAAPTTPAAPPSVSDGQRTARTGIGVGSLLAAGVISLIGALRAGQRRRRRAGERLPMPDLSALRETETAYLALADADAVVLLDRALRHLAGRCTDDGRKLPRLRAARLSGPRIELYLSEPAELAPPWSDLADGTVWACRHDEVPPREQRRFTAPSPYPALISLGEDTDGAAVLLDLEELGCLGVIGTSEETAPILAAAALELATSRWADDLQVTLVGILPELAARVATGRVRHVEHLELVMPELERRAQDVQDLLDSEGAEDLRQARSAQLAHDAWTPEILIVGSGVPAHLTDRVEALVAASRRTGISAVVAGVQTPGTWRLRLSTPETGVLEPASLRLTPQRLGAAELEAVLTLVDGAAGPPVPGPSWSAPGTTEEPGLAGLPVNATTLTVPRAHVDPLPPDASSDGVAELDEEPVHGTQVEAVHRPTCEPTPELSGDHGSEPASGAGSDLGPDGAPDVEQQVARVHPWPSRGPRLNLLGDVHIDGCTGPDPVSYGAAPSAMADQTARATELVGYLCFHRERADAAQRQVTADEQLATDQADTTDEPCATDEPRATDQPGTGDQPGTSHQEDGWEGRTSGARRSGGDQGPRLSELADALFPGQEARVDRTITLLSRTRRWLGTSTDGSPWLPRTDGDGPIVLHPGVRTDWDQIRELIGPSLAAAPTARLSEVLERVNGIPLSGLRNGTWAWAQPWREEILAGLLDVLHELADRAVRAGDAATARRASAAGLRLDPDSELMWRDALRAEYVAGDATGQARLAARLLEQTEDLQLDLDVATQNLLTDLRRAAGQ